MIALSRTLTIQRKGSHKRLSRSIYEKTSYWSLMLVHVLQRTLETKNFNMHLFTFQKDIKSGSLRKTFLKFKKPHLYFS